MRCTRWVQLYHTLTKGCWKVLPPLGRFWHNVRTHSIGRYGCYVCSCRYVNSSNNVMCTHTVNTVVLITGKYNMNFFCGKVKQEYFDLWKRSNMMKKRKWMMYTTLHITQFSNLQARLPSNAVAGRNMSVNITGLIRSAFKKHMCFFVLFFHHRCFFLAEIFKKCFFVLFFGQKCAFFCWAPYFFRKMWLFWRFWTQRSEYFSKSFVLY